MKTEKMPRMLIKTDEEKVSPTASLDPRYKYSIFIGSTYMDAFVKKLIKITIHNNIIQMYILT